MARAINLDHQSTFEADKIKDIVPNRNLPLKLHAIASPVANGAPNKCLGLNGLRALFACEPVKHVSRDFLHHGVKTIQSRRAPRDPPHPSLLRNDTFPRKGGRSAGPFIDHPSLLRNDTPGSSPG